MSSMAWPSDLPCCQRSEKLDPQAEKKTKNRWYWNIPDIQKKLESKNQYWIEKNQRSDNCQNDHPTAAFFATHLAGDLIPDVEVRGTRAHGNAQPLPLGVHLGKPHRSRFWWVKCGKIPWDNQKDHGKGHQMWENPFLHGFWKIIIETKRNDDWNQGRLYIINMIYDKESRNFWQNIYVKLHGVCKSQIKIPWCIYISYPPGFFVPGDTLSWDTVTVALGNDLNHGTWGNSRFTLWLCQNSYWKWPSRNSGFSHENWWIFQ